MVAVLGTTITPYCFFWQASQEAEDQRIDPTAHALLDAPEQAPVEISRMRYDTYIGMGYSNVISLFIIVATAATLNAHGITDIQTSAQAAEALRPIAGVFTFALFAAGIIGIGLLAVPVLAGASAYAIGEALGWTTGLDRKPLDAKAFYGTITVSTLIGVLIMAPVSSFTAPYGARLAHRLSRRTLELAFSIFLLLIAARFLVSMF